MRCTECGGEQARWEGRCAACGAWNTLEEAAEERAGAKQRPVARPEAPSDLEESSAPAVLQGTGLREVDQALGGGIARGSVVLLAGAPGIGKSTLLLQVAAHWAAAGDRVLYLSGEETVSQVSGRAARLKLHTGLRVGTESEVGAILSLVQSETPTLLIVDSVQTLVDGTLPGSAGSLQQVRGASDALRTACKRAGITLILVGQVTKEGGIAGPKTLEHLVDVVLTIEGDARSGLRIVACQKNRYGPTHHVGLLEMHAEGLRDVADPARRFLEEHTSTLPGVALGAVLDGSRLLLAEIQALVVPSRLTMPRRVVTGIDARRVELIIAVLDRFTGTRIAGSDVFLTQLGGGAIRDPGLDLAVALALASSASNTALPKGLVACGEIGLTGEVRPAPRSSHRRELLHGLGFSDPLLPAEGERLALTSALGRVLPTPPRSAPE